jgi:hypothetical protein
VKAATIAVWIIAVMADGYVVTEVSTPGALPRQSRNKVIWVMKVGGNDLFGRRALLTRSLCGALTYWRPPTAGTQMFLPGGNGRSRCGPWLADRTDTTWATFLQFEFHINFLSLLRTEYSSKLAVRAGSKSRHPASSGLPHYEALAVFALPAPD